MALEMTIDGSTSEDRAEDVLKMKVAKVRHTDIPGPQLMSASIVHGPEFHAHVHAHERGRNQVLERAGTGIATAQCKSAF